MAKRPEYTQYSVYSKLDPSSGEFDIPSYERDIRNIINNAVKSALPKDAFFQLGDKALFNNGRVRWDIYVHKDNEAIVGQALSQISEDLKYRGSGDEKYSIASGSVSDAKKSRSLQRYEKALEKKNRQENETSKLNTGNLMKVVGLLTVIASITRRILSSVLNFATQSTKDMITANNLGISQEAVRSYRHTETAHGLKAGTITDALSDIQNKFGNITSLDEKSLEALAVVMGSKIEDMAKMGIGASNPEAILEAILDDFNAKANAGYNSIGQYVGEQQARRELYSYLLKISPQIADIFATMQDEQHNINSLYRNQADTFEEWRKLTPTVRDSNTTTADFGVTVTLGQEWNDVKDLVSQIKELIAVSLALPLMDVLRAIKNIRWGLSETDNRALNKENKEANLNALAKVNQEMSTMKKDWGNLSEYDKAYYRALEAYKEELEKANKGDKNGNIKNVVRTPNELRVMAEEAKAMELLENMLLGSNEDFGATVEEIKDVIDSYTQVGEGIFGKSVDQLREEYNNKVVNKAEKQRDKNVEKEYSKRVKEAEKAKKKQYDTELAQAEKEADKAINDKKSPEYKGSWAVFSYSNTYKNLKTLATLKRLYPKENITSLEGNKHVTKNKDGTYSIIPDYDLSYVEQEAIKADVESNIATNDSLSTDDAFYRWIFSQYSDWFKDKISGARFDEFVAQAEEGTKFSTITALYDTEGRNNSWLDKIPSTYNGVGTIYGYNSKVNGQVVHTVMLKIKDDKGKMAELKLGEFQGYVGYSGEVAQVDITHENGKTDYTMSVGQSASQQSAQNTNDSF